MKFVFDRDEMIKEISIAQEIISTTNSTAILSNVLLVAENNSLTIKATDIKLSFETHIPVDVQEEGSTVVFCSKYISILNTLPQGEIEFSQEQDLITIKPVNIKRIKFTLKSMASENYPELPKADESLYFEVQSKLFKDMISQTAFAVSHESVRLFLNGVFFEKTDSNTLTAVATDTRRLAIIKKTLDTEIPDFNSVIVPPKILNIIKKHTSDEGNISIQFADKIAFFKFGNYIFSSSLIEGKFPTYQRVIPQNQTYNLQVQKSDLTDALKRIALMADKESYKVFLNITPGVLKITSSMVDGSADEEIPCEYASDEMTIALNYNYLLEPLKIIDSERIKIEFTQEMRAVSLKSEPEMDYLHIIMPMNKE